MKTKRTKIKRVLANNRKRCFQIETAKTRYEFPYSRLDHQPSAENPIVSVAVDPELGNEGFTYFLKNGVEDSLVLDQILYYVGDPEYLCKLHLFQLTCDALKIIEKKRLNKRSLARAMNTSPKQLYRLLDTTFYGKTINQMIKLLNVLGHKVEIKVLEANKKAA